MLARAFDLRWAPGPLHTAAPISRRRERVSMRSNGGSGGNVSPALSWSHAPPGTQSFALLMHDPDAPTGSGWWHWVVYNLPASTTSLAAGAGDPTKKLLPPGVVQGRTDFGAPGYGGPCPPQGDKPHRYIFTVFALKTDKVE